MLAFNKHIFIPFVFILDFLLHFRIFQSQQTVKAFNPTLSEV